MTVTNCFMSSSLFGAISVLMLYSLLAIERALEAGRIDVDQTLDMIDRTWPSPDEGTAYSFGPQVARQASDDACRENKRRLRK